MNDKMKETEKLFKKLLPIEISKHIGFVINHQEKGGWGEDIRDCGKNLPSPLVTSQMIIGLLSYIESDNHNYLKRNIINSIKEGIKFLIDSFHNYGWSDYSAASIMVDATGAAVTAIIYSMPYGIVRAKAQGYINEAVKFLVEQQNIDDGGWSMSKGGDSKIQYTYWALKALNSFNKLEFKIERVDINKSISSGLGWLRKNFKKKNSEGFSIVIAGEIGAIATTYGIELFEEFLINYNKEKVFDYYDNSQVKKGCWEIKTDCTSITNIPRRVYVFNDIPRILECFSYLNIRYDSEIFGNILKSILELEDDMGGFKQSINDQYPVGWFTAEVLKMFSTLFNKFRIMPERYINSNNVTSIKKIHSFAKGVLMIGRFRPPHLGHYHGLRAILNGDENEFSLPSEALKELLNVDKVFIGIARYGIDQNNPFTIGEVREIWRQIIDTDPELKSKSNIIEIVTCPCRRDLNNVISAIDELTYKRDSIIVISGNDRIIEQCNQNNIKYFKFKRKNEKISGTEIRNIIAKIKFDKLHDSSEQLKNLREKLHPVAYKIMIRDGILKRAQKNINAI